MSKSLTKVSLNIEQSVNEEINKQRVNYLGLDITISKSEYIKIAIKDKLAKDSNLK